MSLLDYLFGPALRLAHRMRQQAEDTPRYLFGG